MPQQHGAREEGENDVLAVEVMIRHQLDMVAVLEWHPKFGMSVTKADSGPYALSQRAKSFVARHHELGLEPVETGLARLPER